MLDDMAIKTAKVKKYSYKKAFLPLRNRLKQMKNIGT